MGESIFDPLARWLESGLGLLSRATSIVERGAERLFTPVVDELRLMQSDLALALQSGVPNQGQGEGTHSPARLRPRDLRDILLGSERERQLSELDGGDAASASGEEKAAASQLLVGGATLAVSALAAVSAPGLYLFSVAGLAYQLDHTFRAAYRSLTRERRLGVYGLNALVFVGATATGSLLAMALGAFSGSFLRWILAKTEGRVHQGLTQVLVRLPQSAFVVIEGAEVEVPLAQLRLGDTIVVGAGQTIPVDGTVLGGTATVDQRLLTGESLPVDKRPGDSVMASSLVLRGQFSVRLERTGKDTLAAQAAQALSDIADYKHQLATRAEQRQDQLVAPLLAISAAVAPVWGVSSALAVLWSMPGYSMIYLGPITVLSLTHAAAQRGVAIKSSRALERLAAVDTVVFDKTGTLTLEQPVVGRVFSFADVSELELLHLAAAAERGQSHPVARAITQAAQERAREAAGAPDSPEGWTLAMLGRGEDAEAAVGLGVAGTWEGERLRVGSRRMMEHSAVAVPASADVVQSEVHERGRSLCYISRGQTLLGMIELCPTVRPEATPLIAELKRRGKQVLILSGDEEAPTRSVAAQLGLGESNHFAQTTPTAKAALLQRLQLEGRVICYVGDGLNDALALEAADVSVSLKGAVSLATGVAQVVLMGGNLEELILLFDLAERFEHSLRTNRLASTLPAFIILGGTLAFGWSFMTAVLLGQLSLPFIFYALLKTATSPVPPASAIEEYAEVKRSMTVAPKQGAS